MKSKRMILLFLLLAFPLLGSCEIKKSDLDVKKITKTVAYSLPVFHLNHLSLNEGVSTNAFELFINSLDPSHTYFLQSDIDEFRVESKLLGKKLQKGNIDFANKVYDRLMERIKDRTQFIDKQLEKGFDTSVEETFLWDRKKAPWPKDKAEWDEIWRKRIKNEYIARMVSKQVYADDEPTTNQTASTHTNTESNETETVDSATNIVKEADSEYDEDAELARLSPEEFISDRYKQFLSTMESFDEEMLLQRYLSSFTHVYDPHSDYMSPSSLEDFEINMKLSLVGIGAMLRPDDGAEKIVRLIPGGPAERDGRLKPGDKIIAVAQGDEKPVSIMHWPSYKAVRLIRGEKGTKVVLTVIPAADRSGTLTKRIDLIRDEVKLEEQAAKGKVREIKTDNGKTMRLGVLELPDFYADFKATSNHEKDARRASVDVRRILGELEAEGVEGIVLDLRNNGGGSLVEAIDIAGLFIPSGPVVQVRDRRGVQVLPDADPATNYDGPLLVLVNRLSASASEILAAALQDYHRALVVGDEKTHGKGTVQTLLAMGGTHRGSLKLTTAGFYRINGGSTQLKGVVPDLIIPDYLDVMGLGEEELEHALPWDTIRPALYRTLKGYVSQIPELKARSKKRLEKDEEFQSYFAKRARLKKRFDEKTISLSLQQRLEEAEAEKELDDLQSGAFLDDEKDEDDDSKDIILKEALQILADMIELQKTEPVAAEQ